MKKNKGATRWTGTAQRYWYIGRLVRKLATKIQPKEVQGNVNWAQLGNKLLYGSKHSKRENRIFKRGERSRNPSNNHKWSGQCAKAANRAMVALGIIKGAFGSLDRDMFRILYGTYMRPHLEYGVQAWSPYYKKDLLQLEKEQRRATKMVTGLRKLDYGERLASLNRNEENQRSSVAVLGLFGWGG